ncbi:unnamed protein product [Schistosoma intercalatum]|nr:unnamed protein product [Schistosoma intercalatum]CAH8439300.1 unnamed protein product [Schistosoma intercalatum]
MPPKLGYWKIRGLAQPIRLLLEYLEETYEEHAYDRNEVDAWRNDKFKLGLEFPNVEYQFYADKHNMLGACPEERAEISMLEGAILDIKTSIWTIACNKEYQTLKVDFLNELREKLKMFEDHLSNKTYLNGNCVTHPDFMLYDTLDVVLYMDSQCLNELPKLVCFKQCIEDLPQIKNYLNSSRYIKWPLLGWSATFGDGDAPSNKINSKSSGK